MSRRLTGDIGYLRIPSMSSSRRHLSEIHHTLERLQDTKGLIIDVRGNGGGSRDVLRAVFPYLMKKGDTPRVVNVAAYRLGEGENAGAGEGYLQNRFLYPVTSSTWSPAARRAIRDLAGGFRPEWTPPAGDFSTWHYMVIERPENRAPHTYEHSVVVLLDGGCFSATDIFLGALKGWRNVRLVGTASGGGSGRARSVDLTHSRLRLRLSSMASFRPTGRLYDGNGIEPDVVVKPAPTDFLGRTDTQLDAALKLLR